MGKTNTTKVLLDLQNYPLEAVYGASYVFLDKTYVFLKSKASGKIEINLTGKEKLTSSQLNSLKGEFLNELLNYALRVNLAKQNRKIREFIISQALLGAVEGIKPEEQNRDIKTEDDPLGIAMTWEERYGAAQKKAVQKKKKENKGRSYSS